MRVLPWLLVSTLMTLFIASASAQSRTPSDERSSKMSHTSAERHPGFEVIDPYVEMHTGPGRGYPIFYVIEQGEKINIIKRRPDWYEVSTKGNRRGWVKAAQIARTLQPTGEPVDLPSVSYGDYLKNSWRLGFSVGPFSDGSFDEVDSFITNAGYRPLTWLGFDLEYGFYYGDEIRGNLYNLNAVIEPFSRWKASPVLLLGRGKLIVDQQPLEVANEIDDSDFNMMGLGLHYYIGRSFVIRGEYRNLTITTEQKDERVSTWQIGFITFF